MVYYHWTGSLEENKDTSGQHYHTFVILLDNRRQYPIKDDSTINYQVIASVYVFLKVQ